MNSPQVKCGASSRRPLSHYCLGRNSIEITIGKTHPALFLDLFSLEISRKVFVFFSLKSKPIRIVDHEEQAVHSCKYEYKRLC